MAEESCLFRRYTCYQSLRRQPHNLGSLQQTASHCILIACWHFYWDGLTIFLCAMAVTSRLKSHLLVPREPCSHSLGRQNRRFTEILNWRYAFMSCMVWQHFPSFGLAVHNSSDFDSALLASSVSHCARDGRLNSTRSPPSSWGTTDARCCHLYR